MTFRLVVSWILGGILITIAAWILGHIEQTVGVSPLSYALALFIAFILILVGGLVWITVASSVSKHG